MSKSSLRARRALTPVVSLVFLLVSGCKKDSATSPPAIAAAMAPAKESNAQIGTVGQPLGRPMSVLVTDQNGNPVPLNTQVTWTVVGKGGAVSLATDTAFSNTATSGTDSFGYAAVTWQLGTGTGTDSLTATAASGVSTVFTATAQPGAVAALNVQQGNAQTVPMDSTTQPIVVQALDQFGNPVPGVTIAWIDPNGGTLSTSTTVTDANGLASVQLTTAPGIPTYTIVAEVVAKPTIEATVTVFAQ
jgi:adhesin/invasin